MKKITLRWLQKNKACIEQRKLFRNLYPNGIPVCWKCFQEAQRKGLDVFWLRNLISPAMAAFTIKEMHRLPPSKYFPELAQKYLSLNKNKLQFYYPNWPIHQTSNEFLKELEEVLLKL